MKHTALTKTLGIAFFLAFAFPAFAQFPNLSGKLVQGKQTTALGITSYSDTVPLHTPTPASWRNNTLSHVDTTFGVVYQWRYPRWYATSVVRQSSPPPAAKAAGSNFVDYTETLWQNSTDSLTYYYEEKQQCWEPIGTVVRDTMPVSTSATATSAAVCYEYSLWYNSTNDSLYAYTAGAWLAVGSGGGTSGAVDSIVVLQDSIIVGYSEGDEVTRDTVHFPAFGTMNNWNLQTDSGSPITIGDGGTVDIGGGYGINTSNSFADVTVEVDTTQIATQSDLSVVRDTATSKINGTLTNLRIPVAIGTKTLGNSTLLQSSTGVTLDANLAYRITGGSTGSRPTGAAGMIYYNTSNNWFDMHNGTSWFNPLRSATATGLGTAGRVFYADANGEASGSANLFWDITNSRLGIGTATPLQALHIKSAAATRFVVDFGSTAATNFGELKYYDNGTDIGGVSMIGSTFTTANRRGELIFFATLDNSSSVNFSTREAATIKTRMRITNNGNLAIGNALVDGSILADRILHPQLSTAQTNTVGTVAKFSHYTSATAAAGMGTGIEFEAESAAGNNRIIADLTGIFTTATNAAEVSDFSIRTMRAGTLTESLRSLGNGTLQVGTFSGTATQMIGATSGNILTAITLGAGLSFSSGTLNAAFLPLTLTGTTEVNTAGQTLRIRDAAGYPDMFMDSNYWSVSSDVNTFIDVGSTSGQMQVIAASRLFAASAGSLEIQAATELRLDGDSLVLDGVYPVGAPSDSVLVQDATTKRAKLIAQSDIAGVSLFTGGANEIQDQTFPYYTESDNWAIVSETSGGAKLWLGAPPLNGTDLPVNPVLPYLSQGIYSDNGSGTYGALDVGGGYGSLYTTDIDGLEYAGVFAYDTKVEITGSSDGSGNTTSLTVDAADIFLNSGTGLIANTGIVTVGRGATGAGILRFQEDTDNGVHNLAITAPASITATETFSLKATDGTASQTIVTGISPVTATLDFPSTAPGVVNNLTVTVTGAAVGDLVTIGVPNASVPAEGSYFAWVSATNTVTVRYVNNSLLNTYDPASGSFKVRVDK